MSILAAMSWVAATLFVCFKTSAVYEYLKSLPLPNWLTHMKDYEADRKYDFGLSYKMYMMTMRDSFFIRLVTCPYCLGAWLSLGFSWGFSCLEWLPVVYLGGLLGYTAIGTVMDRMENNNGN